MRRFLLTTACLAALLLTGCSDNSALRSQVNDAQRKVAHLRAQQQEMARVQHDVTRLQNRIRETQTDIAKLKKRRG